MAYLKNKRESAQATASAAKDKWVRADRASIQAGAVFSAAQKQRDQRLGDLKALDAGTNHGLDYCRSNFLQQRQEENMSFERTHGFGSILTSYFYDIRNLTLCYSSSQI